MVLQICLNLCTKDIAFVVLFLKADSPLENLALTTLNQYYSSFNVLHCAVFLSVICGRIKAFKHFIEQHVL